MGTLLIAEASQEMTEGIEYFLQGEFKVEVCHDGETALELMQSLQPDALILNLMLPYKDGLTLLQESVYRPPVILAVTHFANTYTAERALQLGVSTILVSPTPKTVAVRMVDMFSGIVLQETATTPQSRAALKLHLMGFASYLDGYRQLCVGIPLFREDSQQSLSKELYPKIAKVCDKSVKCVEHSIRNCIVQAWRRGGAKTWDRYFPGIKSCPSNKAFIARMAQMLDE